MKPILLIASFCIMFNIPNARALSTGSSTLIPVCNPSVTVTSIASATDCFSLSASVVHPGAPDSYFTWNFGDGTPNETGRMLNHCYTSETVPGNTTRTVTLSYFNTALNCAGSATAALNVSVIPVSPCPNVPPAFTRAASTVTVWAGSMIPEIVTSYDFGDGSAPGPNAIHTYTACGNYIVHVTYWDMNMPNQVCHNYVAINISCSAPTGIRELSGGHVISVFPNPTSDLIYVKAKEPVKTITVTDPSGRTVAVETPANPAEPALQTAHLAPGTYFMTIGLHSGARKTVLFIKH